MADPRQPFSINRGGAPSFDIRGLAALAVVAFVVAGLARGVYTVGPESVGVVQRFGRFIGTTGPGLRFKLPFGIDTVTILPVKRQLKMEFGFGSAATTNPDQVSREQANGSATW
jgi:modulator of FtsH protease HflK